jgi:pilus assembly protein CpaE
MTTSSLHLTVVSQTPVTLAKLLGPLGITPICTPVLPAPTLPPAEMPDVIVMDLRNERTVPPAVGELTRRFPALGIVIVAAGMETSMMLEALHAGAKGFVAEPLTTEQLDEAIQRVVAPREPQIGRVVAFVGAKGGVGTTTLAVNVAVALARASKGDALLIDLNTRYGDVTACLGVEPRFTVADALENAHRLDKPYMRGLVAKAAADLDVLAASDRVAPGTTDVMRLRALLEFAKHNYLYTVLDVPRTDPAVLDALESASHIVLVVSQELTAVRSAVRMVHALRHHYTPERVQIALARQDRNGDIQAEDLSRTLGGPIRVFPSDYRQALECLNRGRPLILENHSRLAGEMNKFVRDLTGVAAQPVKATKPSILPRWLGGHS